MKKKTFTYLHIPLSFGALLLCVISVWLYSAPWFMRPAIESVSQGAAANLCRKTPGCTSASATLTWKLAKGGYVPFVLVNANKTFDQGAADSMRSELERVFANAAGAVVVPYRLNMKTVVVVIK